MTPDQFWAKVEMTDTCWLWTGTRSQAGYGRVSLDNARTTGAHRISYELVVGPIPAGLVLDHLCRNPPCVNPAHLEPVTTRENVLRGESPPAKIIRAGVCPKGHPRNSENLYTYGSNGHHRCRPCHRAEYHRRKAAGLGVRSTRPRLPQTQAVCDYRREQRQRARALAAAAREPSL